MEKERIIKEEYQKIMCSVTVTEQTEKRILHRLQRRTGSHHPVCKQKNSSRKQSRDRIIRPWRSIWFSLFAAAAVLLLVIGLSHPMMPEKQQSAGEITPFENSEPAFTPDHLLKSAGLNSVSDIRSITLQKQNQHGVILHQSSTSNRDIIRRMYRILTAASWADALQWPHSADRFTKTPSSVLTKTPSSETPSSEPDSNQTVLQIDLRLKNGTTFPLRLECRSNELLVGAEHVVLPLCLPDAIWIQSLSTSVSSTVRFHSTFA